MFTLSTTDKISKIQDKIDTILDALGYPEALVTDESTVYDFVFSWDDEIDNDKLSRASKKLGVILNPEDYLWEVAERLPR